MSMSFKGWNTHAEDLKKFTNSFLQPGYRRKEVILVSTGTWKINTSTYRVIIAAYNTLLIKISNGQFWL